MNDLDRGVRHGQWRSRSVSKGARQRRRKTTQEEGRVGSRDDMKIRMAKVRNVNDERTSKVLRIEPKKKKKTKQNRKWPKNEKKRRQRKNRTISRKRQTK